MVLLCNMSILVLALLSVSSLQGKPAKGNEDRADREVCPYWQFKCSSNECIDEWYICDGDDQDCKDGSDEENCQDSVCPPDTVSPDSCLCASGSGATTKCIAWQRCNADGTCQDDSKPVRSWIEGSRTTVSNGIYIQRGNTINNMTTSGQEECSSMCSTTDGCVAWTMRLSDNFCWIKSDNSRPLLKGGFITGLLGCGANGEIRGKPVCAELWEHGNYSGDSFKLYYNSPVSDLVKTGWNDKITSIRVMEDFAVEGYENINQEGEKLEITEDKSLLSKNNWISSISCQKKCAVLWEHENYKGDFLNLYFNNPVSNLVTSGWNDKITSIRVSENFAVEAYEHTYENGKKLEITEDKSLLSENDWISSISCQKKRLNKGESLTGGQFLRSISGEYKFIVQKDGNLVIYQNGSVTWASSTQGSVSKLILQDDGNLVLYSTNGKLIWESNTVDASAAYLEMQDDGNLVLYTTTGSALWASDIVYVQRN